MTVEIHKKEYSHEINLIINTGSTCEEIERGVIQDCSSQLSETSLKKQYLRDIVNKVKELTSNSGMKK